MVCFIRGRFYASNYCVLDICVMIVCVCMYVRKREKESKNERERENENEREREKENVLRIKRKKKNNAYLPTIIYYRPFHLYRRYMTKNIDRRRI